MTSTQPTTRPDALRQVVHRSPARQVNHLPPTRRVLVPVRWPVGGIRTHVLYTYPAAAARGYRFTFVGPADETFETFAASLAGLPGSEFVGVPVRGRRRCRLWPTVRRLARTGAFALLHSHGLTAAVHAGLANLDLRLPHVTTVHDPLRPEQFRGLTGRGKRWLLGRLLRRIDTAVCVSADIRANLLDYLPPLRRDPGRLVTICNGIDIGRCADLETGPPDPELRRRLGIGPDVFLLGFLGRFMEQKGFLPLLQALQQLLQGPAVARPFHLVAVGSGDYRREYQRAVAQGGLDRHVTFLDFVLDVRPILRQLDLLVVPSLWEASSLVSMEAMAAGVPVLGTDCIGLREVLHDTPSRLVRAGDAAALAAGLRDALARPWTEAARAFAPEARRRFDSARSARRLVDLFDRTCGVGFARASAAA
jgi:glycosyltransferase involved in cell wall biosynthesis